MSWSNVKLIFFREVRDQLRDRRTLFMIFILPLLLYPFMGMSFFQMAQFMRKHVARVLVVGDAQLPDVTPLVLNSSVNPDLLAEGEARLFDLSFDGTDAEIDLSDPETIGVQTRQLISDGKCDVVLYFPSDFGERLEEFRTTLRERAGGESEPDDVGRAPHVPSPLLYYNLSSEKSQLAYVRMLDLLERWRSTIQRENVELISPIPEVADQPFEISTHDVAENSRRDAAIWSKIFPFLLLVWALTGAFYPAVDLCAGEKERGTLETLLISPAERSEIVWGKLFTVMLFSVVSCLLNIASMGAAGYFIISQLPQIGPPPLISLLWLSVALLPVSALFSALCLALAAFARSSKEGQYYLMPLVLLTLPLVLLPIAPGVELTLGNSLIPVTGVVLLLRMFMEANYWQALPYVPPVVCVTGICCLLSIRWAIDQFNSESVLFRESERFDVRLWVRQLLRDREPLPTVAEAVFCGAIIMLIRYFMSFALPMPATFDDFVVHTIVTQLVVILTPVMVMAVILTRSPRRTLLIQMPPLATLPIAFLLAVFLHPVINTVQIGIMWLYPLGEEMLPELERLNMWLLAPESLWMLILAIAVVPAICEELAFRGLILSGLRRTGSNWRALALSSVFFGMAHGFFQQSLVASLVGAVIGYIAIQSGSIFPGILFHMTHNTLALMPSRVTPELQSQYPILNWVYASLEGDAAGTRYSWSVVVLGALVAVVLLNWLRRQSSAAERSAAAAEAVDTRAAHSMAGS